MKNFLKIISVLILVSNPIFSQEEPSMRFDLEPEKIDFFNKDYNNNGIIINQSRTLEEYFETVAGINKKRNGFSGFRVKIFTENHRNARNNANDLRLKFNSKQDTVKAYVIYSEPNFEVHAGDFRTRFEAVRFLKKISDEFPEAYIIRTNINFPEL